MCQGTADWTGFSDATRTPVRYRQEKVFHLYRDDVWITLVGMYESASERDAVRREANQSEKPVQHGVVVARHSTPSEASAVVSALGLSCEERP